MKGARLGRLVVVVMWLFPSAVSAATLRGHVTSGARAIKGAFVTATNPQHHVVAVTDGGGAYEMSLSGGTYQLAANAPGFQATVVDDVQATGSTVNDLALTTSGLSLRQAPIYGGAQAVGADGTPGVFYVAGDNAADLYRTLDWGGTWTPVTVSRDDAANGLTGVRGPGVMTTSGFPGEIALSLFDNGTYYSTDYGVTWRALIGLPNGANQLLWGHAGNVSVMVAVDGVHMYVADMTAADPTFFPMTKPYADVASPTTIGVGNGADRPWVATVNSAGHLLVYRLLAQPAAPAPTIDEPGFDPTSGTFPASDVALGGRSAPGAPPSGVMVASQDWIAMSLKAAGALSYPAPSSIGNGLNLPGHPAGGPPCSAGFRAEATRR